MRKIYLLSIVSGLFAFLLGCTPKPVPSITPTLTRPLATPTFKATIPVTMKETPTEVWPTPVWNDENGLIAYHKYTLDYDYLKDRSIYITDSKGQHKVNVLAGLAGDGGDYSWSPSGNWLVFNEYEITATPTNLPDDATMEEQINAAKDEMLRSSTLWAIRSDGTDRHKLMTVNKRQSVIWAQNQDRFFFNCVGSDKESELCISDPETDKIIKTGHIGANPQFSPDGENYAYLANERKLYIVDTDTQISRLLLAPSSGYIGGFAWKKDQKSILAEVVKKDGCGNNLDGDSSIVEINVETKAVKTIRNVKWSFGGFKLSPDEKYILSRWWLCVGNAYEMDGVIGLDDNHVTWPIQDQFTFHQWTSDGKYLISSEIGTGYRYLVNPLTGNHVSEIAPPFIDAFLTDDERKHGVYIYWTPQKVR